MLAGRRSGKDSGPLAPWLRLILAFLVAGGVAAFFVLLAGSEPARAWQIFLVNFLFWSGIAVAGVVWAAIFQVTNARWPVPVQRLGEVCAVCLPLSFLLFIVVWFGRYELFPWAEEPPPSRAAWLNLPFLFGREAICLLLLYGAALLFAHRSLRQVDPDANANSSPNRAALQKAAVGLLIFYASVYTVFAWDFVMSLDPDWFSTLFGAYYFVGNLYLGLAILTALTILAPRRYNLSETAPPKVLHNLGKLLFCFSLLWAYLFWSQYLVIWYGNLPSETGFILVRTERAPWSTLAILVLVTNFLIPFALLLFRAAKENQKTLLLSALVIVAGMWLERFLLVAPSITPEPRILLGWEELMITAGFFASFALTYIAALQRLLVPKKPELPLD